MMFFLFYQIPKGFLPVSSPVFIGIQSSSLVPNGNLSRTGQLTIPSFAFS